MTVAFVLLPNRKSDIILPAEQKRFWDAQWLGRLKSTKKATQCVGTIPIPFDQPEIPYTSLYLLGLLKKIKNLSVCLVDTWESGTKTIDTSKLQLSDQNAEVYLFSPFTSNYSFAKECLDEIKSHNNKAKCIIGGHHASYCADECLSDGFDYVVVGRGEKAIMKLASSSWCSNSRIIRGDEGTKDEQLLWQETLPAYELLPDRYKQTYYARLFTTHGCPFQCIFCSNTVWHKRKPVFMQLNRVQQELELIRSNISFKEIYVNDENFTIREDHYKPLSKYLFEQKVIWGCETRIDGIDQKKLKFLSEMGCKEIDYGLESLDQNILEIARKGISAEDAYRVFSETTNSGIRCHVNLMIGLPGETAETATTTVNKICDWIKKGIISTVDYFVTVPYPGTFLYNHADKYDLRIKTNDWDLYREDSIPVFDHNTMTSDEIYTYWTNGLMEFSKTIESIWSKDD